MKMPPRLLSLPDLDVSGAKLAPDLSSDRTAAQQAIVSDACAPAAPIPTRRIRGEDAGPVKTWAVSHWKMLVVVAGVGCAVSAVWWQASLRTMSGPVRDTSDGSLATPGSLAVNGSLEERTKVWAYLPVRDVSTPIQWADGQLEVKRLQAASNPETTGTTSASPETNVHQEFPAATMEMQPAVRDVSAQRLSAPKPVVLGVPIQESVTAFPGSPADFPSQRDANIGDYFDTTRKTGDSPGRQDSIRR